jgi:hypothetical protein
MIKSKTQPFCRWCGRKLRKATEDINLKTSDGVGSFSNRNVVIVDPLPQTVAECVKHTNKTIVGVRRCKTYDSKNDCYTDRGIDRILTWDGDSYQSNWGYFCTNDCAAALGRAAVGRDLCGPDYNKAVAAAKKGDQ